MFEDLFSNTIKHDVAPDCKICRLILPNGMKLIIGAYGDKIRIRGRDIIPIEGELKSYKSYDVETYRIIDDRKHN